MRRSRPPCLPAFFRKAGGWREMFGFAGLSLRRYARTSSVAAISPDIFEEIPNAQPAPNCISATDMLSILASRRSFAPPKILFPHPAAPASKQQRKDPKSTVIVDVRSPIEYNYAHVPTAFNVPLFTDEQRKEIGILYKSAGKREAILRGLQLAGPNFASMLRQIDSLFASSSDAEKELIVYCARGGMRSRCMAFLFSLPDSGLSINVMKGGYKAFRNEVLSKFLEPRRVVVLGGLTGSGKTKVLHSLAAMGEQVIDLEGWSHHKGSAFGGLGETSPGSPEMIENGLAVEWAALDTDKHVWLEDESRHIGGYYLPPGVFDQIRNAEVIQIQQPDALRWQHLFDTYCKYEKEDIKACVKNITKRLGTERTNRALQQIDNNDIMPALKDVLAYYDKTYNTGLSQRRPNSVHLLGKTSILLELSAQPPWPTELQTASADESASIVLDYFNASVKGITGREQ